jgi:hypothetical protein
VEAEEEMWVAYLIEYSDQALIWLSN